MSSKMSKNIISDITSIDSALHIMSERVYSIGLSLFRVSNEKRPKIMNPIVVTSVLSVLLIREIVSYSVADPRLSMMIGDMSFNWKLKPMWNLTVVVGILICLSHQTIHYFYGMRNDFPFWLIVVNNTRDETIKTKYRYLIKLVEMSIKLWLILVPLTTIVIYLFSSTTTESLTYGLFATFSNFCLIYYAVPIVLWEVLCYCLIAYRFKLKLKLENNSLLQLSKRIDRNIATKVMNYFQAIDRIHGSIQEFDSFWSRITLIFTILLSIAFCISISQLFGKVELIMVMTLALIAMTCSIGLATIFVSASSIYIEANNGHRILFKLIRQKKVTENVYLRLKVNNFLEIDNGDKKFVSLQVMQFIERLSSMQIGFHCGPLYIITQYKLAEVFSILLFYYCF